MSEIILQTISMTLGDIFTLTCIVIYAIALGYNLHDVH